MKAMAPMKVLVFGRDGQVARELGREVVAARLAALASQGIQQRAGWVQIQGDRRSFLPIGRHLQHRGARQTPVGE
jgi:hypothetical protein